MKILVAPSAYKGTLSPVRLAEAIAAGVKKAKPESEVQLAPIADGGDGTIEILRRHLGGQLDEVEVSGPTGEPVLAQCIMVDSFAVIELASACGLALLKGKTLSPLQANTFGLGQVIKHCLNYPMDNLLIGLGGSASTDGGTGALTALGAQFLDGQGRPLSAGGGALSELVEIDLSGLDNRLFCLSIELAVDVDAPLIGSLGAARLFSPQKGAKAEEVEILELGLMKLADVFERTQNLSLRDLAGVGDAGGTAFGLMAGLGATLSPGFSLIAQLLNLSQQIEGSDLVITAEGKLDHQSFLGKATGQLAKMCQAVGRPLWVLPGAVEPGLCWQDYGIDRVLPAAQADHMATEQDVVIASSNIFNL